MVLSGDQLDALCALGLQSRVVGAALPDGSDESAVVPGRGGARPAGGGHPQQPGHRRHRGAAPGSDPGLAGPDSQAIRSWRRSPRRCSPDAPGAAWEDNMRGVGAATARSGAADEVLDDFSATADADRRRPVTPPTSRRRWCSSPTTACGCTGRPTSPASVLRPRRRGPAGIAAVHRSAVHRDRPQPMPIWPAGRTSRRPTATSSTCRSPHRRPRRERPPCSTASPGAGCPPTAIAGCSSSTTRCGRPGRAPIAARGVVDDLHWVSAPIN